MALNLKNIFGIGGKFTKNPFIEGLHSGSVVVGDYLLDRERNPDLNGQKKYQTYEDLALNISIVGASLRLYSDLFAKAEWSAEPVDESAEAKRYAELLEDILFSSEQTFENAVRGAGLHVFWGFSVQEMTAEKRDDGIIGLKSIDLRPCRTFYQWDRDDSGSIINFIQRNPANGQDNAIPRWKAIYCVDNLLTDSPIGTGMFRMMAETAHTLKELQISEKIAINRDMRGLPFGRAPISEINKAVNNGEITQEQADAALEGLKNLVTMVKKGEQTGIILDSKQYDNISETSRNVSSTPQWDLKLLESETTGLSDVDKVIRRLNVELARIAGTEILLLGSDGTGSLALAQDKSASLMLRVNGTLKDVAGQFNRDLVSFIWKVNEWPEEYKPKLTVSEISNRDIEQLAATIRDLASAGITLTRGDEAADELFRLAGLTPPEEETVQLDQEVF